MGRDSTVRDPGVRADVLGCRFTRRAHRWSAVGRPPQPRRTRVGSLPPDRDL